MVEGVSTANKNPHHSLSRDRGLIHCSVHFTIFIGLIDMIELAFDEWGKAASQSNLRVDSDKAPPSVMYASIDRFQVWERGSGTSTLTGAVAIGRLRLLDL